MQSLLWGCCTGTEAGAAAIEVLHQPLSVDISGQLTLSLPGSLGRPVLNPNRRYSPIKRGRRKAAPHEPND